VLRSFAGLHDLSAALVIGGKDLADERELISKMNIVIATPGRLLQHMDETASFEGSTLQVLVMDEVDRMLDLGFKSSVDMILKNLPTERQTLLFSATVGKSIRDLGRLNMRPDYENIQIDNFDMVKSQAETGAEQNEDEKLKSITP
jgi:ATP-dependent RNA helicase DDX10/DBP4